MLKVGATGALLALVLSGCAHTGAIQGDREGQRSFGASGTHVETKNMGMDRHLITIQKGDSLLKVIGRAHGNDAFYYAMTLYQQREMSEMYPGDIYEVMVDSRGQVARIAKKLPSGKWLAAEKLGLDIIMSEQDMVSQYSEHLVSGDLKYDLKGDLARQGIPSEVINQSLEIMGHKVDVRKTYQPGDTFTVIYRQPMLDGQKVGDPYVTSVKYKNEGKSFFAYRHKTRNGHVGYYDERGKALASSWLKEPIESYSRISSHFNPKRRHPISGKIRPHNGVDFAAPSGTPIYAASDGVINHAGRKGGHGIYVGIDHMGDIKTGYSHMSRLGKGVRSGMPVKKGDLIGYVGTTGYSTGAHLHYEMWVRGVAKDPLTQTKNIAGSLQGSELSRFIASRDAVTPLMLRGMNYVAVHDVGQDSQG